MNVKLVRPWVSLERPQGTRVSRAGCQKLHVIAEVVVNLLETTTDYSPWTALDVVRVSTRAMIRYL